MPPKKKKGYYPKTPKLVLPDATPTTVSIKSFPESVYTQVPPNKYGEVPVNTQVGYSYRKPDGKIINIKSAFVQQHTISASGEPMLILRCGTKNWINMYKDIARLYYFNRDKEKIRKMKEIHPTNHLVNIGKRVSTLESKVEILLRRSI